MDMISLRSSLKQGLRCEKRRVTFQAGLNDRCNPPMTPRPRKRRAFDSSSESESESENEIEQPGMMVSASDTAMLFSAVSAEEVKQEPDARRQPLADISSGLNRQQIRDASKHYAQVVLICETCACDIDAGHSHFKCPTCKAPSHTTCALTLTKKCNRCKEPAISTLARVDLSDRIM